MIFRYQIRKMKNCNNLFFKLTWWTHNFDAEMSNAVYFLVARKRNKEVVEQNKVDAETSSTDLRPAAMKNRGKILDMDEESVNGAKETKTLQKNYSQQNMARYGKPKRKAPNPGEGMTTERKQMATKPARPDKPPRPNSIMRMAALIKGKRKAPNPPSKSPKEVKHEKVAVVKTVWSPGRKWGAWKQYSRHWGPDWK